VAWPRLAINEEDMQMAREMMGDRFTAEEIARIRWPERRAALLRGKRETRSYGGPIQVDGHGHIYMFPYVPWTRDLREIPVDVYSSEGKLLFAGMIDAHVWTAARGYQTSREFRPRSERLTSVAREAPGNHPSGHSRTELEGGTG
jgi:hypothetical protein